jgi:hypothetical protein
MLLQHDKFWLLPHGLRFSISTGVAEAATTNVRTARIFLASIVNLCWMVEALGLS